MRALSLFNWNITLRAFLTMDGRTVISGPYLLLNSCFERIIVEMTHCVVIHI